MTSFADAAIPGVALAQGIGRWGNWFNNELYGGPTSLPWRLQIHCMDLIQGHAQPCSGVPGTSTTLGYFQPTFLYESLWDLALGFALIYADRRWRLGRGNLFALYAMGYTLGRGWIEALRSDYAHHILGLRLNDWVSILVFLGGLAWFLRHGGLRGGREPSVYTRDREADGSPDVEDPSTASPGAPR
jgi:prolipoprotein diacylglyceryl transferase